MCLNPICIKIFYTIFYDFSVMFHEPMERLDDNLKILIDSSTYCNMQSFNLFKPVSNYKERRKRSSDRWATWRSMPFLDSYKMEKDLSLISLVELQKRSEKLISASILVSGICACTLIREKVLFWWKSEVYKQDKSSCKVLHVLADLFYV